MSTTRLSFASVSISTVLMLLLCSVSASAGAGRIYLSTHGVDGIAGQNCVLDLSTWFCPSELGSIKEHGTRTQNIGTRADNRLTRWVTLGVRWTSQGT